MSVFKGAIETYNDQGEKVGTTYVDNGVFTGTDGEGSPCEEEVEPFNPNEENENNNTNNEESGGGGYANNDYQSSTEDLGGGSWIDGGPDWQPCTLTNVYYVPCPQQVAEGDTTPSPHWPSRCQNGTGPGSGYVYVWDCGGVGSRQMTNAKTSDDPCDGPVAVLLNMDALKADIEECLGDDYDSGWFDAEENQSEVMDIAAYLEDNCTDESKRFVDLAMEAIDEGGEVDYENKIIFDSTWNDLDCEKTIVKSSTFGFGDISNSIQFLFGNNPNISLTYTTGDIVSPPGQLICAKTVSDFDNQNNLDRITVTFNNEFLNQATDLMIFSIGLHENLHAILTLLLENELIEVDNENVNLSFLVEEYAEYKANWIINQNPEYNPEDLLFLSHESISDLVDDIAQEIRAYGISKGYDILDFHYEALAWSGLEDTLNFTLLEPDFQESIEEILDHETTNFEPLAEGQPCN